MVKIKMQLIAEMIVIKRDIILFILEMVNSDYKTFIIKNELV